MDNFSLSQAESFAEKHGHEYEAIELKRRYAKADKLSMWSSVSALLLLVLPGWLYYQWGYISGRGEQAPALIMITLGLFLITIEIENRAKEAWKQFREIVEEVREMYEEHLAEEQRLLNLYFELMREGDYDAAERLSPSEADEIRS